MTTEEQYHSSIKVCRDVFVKKLSDYGAAWRIMRPQSITDQLFIKANRIRSIETKGVSKVEEGFFSEFIAIVNYGIIGLIQLQLGVSETDDLDKEKAYSLYDSFAQQAFDLMMDKNHDYDEAWRTMRVSSYTDLILMKIDHFIYVGNYTEDGEWVELTTREKYTPTHWRPIELK